MLPLYSYKCRHYNPNNFLPKPSPDVYRFPNGSLFIKVNCRTLYLLKRKSAFPAAPSASLKMILWTVYVFGQCKCSDTVRLKICNKSTRQESNTAFHASTKQDTKQSVIFSCSILTTNASKIYYCDVIHFLPINL